MSLKTKRKLDQAENNLFNKLKQGISQHNYQLPKSGTKGVTGSRGGSMYSNVKDGASLYDDPKSIINSGFSPQQGGQSDVLDNAMNTVGGVDIGKSFKGRERGSGEGRSEEVTITKKGAAAPGANNFLNTDNDAARIERMKKDGELATGEELKDINKESANGPQKMTVKSNNTVDETLGNIKNPTNNDPDAGRFLKGVRTENGGRLADGYLDLGNGFKQAQALVKNIKANQQSKSDPLSSNFKPGKLKRQTRRFIKQGVKSNEEFGNDDYRTNLDGLKPIDDANYNPKEGQKGLKPIPRGYMAKNMSNQQEIQQQKIAKIASNLKPTSNNPNGQTNDEFNRGQMPEFKKLDDNYPDLALGVDGAIKKETKRKNLNDQVKASKPAIENKNKNDKANLESVSGKIQDIDRGEGSIKGTPAVNKSEFELANSRHYIKNNKSATHGGMLRGTSPKMTSRNNPKFNSTIGKGSDPSRITSGSITPSNPVNIKRNPPVVKSNKKQKIGENPSGSKDKASASNPESVSKQSRKNYLTSGINPNKKNTTVNKKPSGKNTTPVNNNKNKNTKKINTRKLNPTVNNKFNLEDELASVSSKKGL